MEQAGERKKSRLPALLASLVFIAAAGYFGLLYYLSLPLCNLPIEYSIGSLDPRFNVSQNDFKSSAQKAGDIWNSQTGERVFALDDSNQIKINFIYDQRQENIDKLNSQAQVILQNKNELQSMDKTFASLVKKYKQDLSDFNSQIESWNAKGGAPEPQFSQLKAKQQELEKTRETLNNMAATLDQKVDQHNSSIDNYNLAVEESKNKIITQGEYDPQNKTIDIYTYGGLEELEFVIAHELGHAAGLDHVDNPKSLLYYLIQDQDIKNPILTAQDKQALDKTCNLNVDFFRPNWNNLKKVFRKTAIIQ